MLWVAAQTSDSAFVTSPSARGRVCQQLLELTIGLLKPLIHGSTGGTPNFGSSTVVSGVALSGFGVALPGQAHEMEFGSPGARGALDDVATYLHLATVVSASEYKAASLRWWNAAWSLARELKLGKELPPNPEPPGSTELDNGQGGASPNDEAAAPLQSNGSAARVVLEEEREERRRIWWLLYSMDRHLALCYNRPLFLLDVECADLLQPVRDVFWQAGEFYSGNNNTDASHYRRRGPPLECTGHSIFGYFLPLMTILGEIVELNQARNHPRFGLGFHDGGDWTDQIQEISRQLEAYSQSLKHFEAQNISAPEPNPAAEGAGNGEHTHLI